MQHRLMNKEVGQININGPD